MSEHVHTPQCKELLGDLSDYIDGQLQAELCATIEEHMKTCENCRIVVNTLRKTVELYEQAHPKEEALPPDVRERLFLRLDLENFGHKTQGKSA